MTALYPLVLAPIFKERVWGGRALEAVYGPSLPAGAIGEAWLLGEHPQGTNVVANGPLAGTSLEQLRRDFGDALLGTEGMRSPSGRVPLLVKLLDAAADLSVQVHPADGYAGLPPGELGKAEMWYVLAAKPGAEVVYGLHEGMDSAAFAAAVQEGRIDQCLRRVPVSAGDVFYVPPGTVHSLGAGVLVAEVQQSSDAVYRVYDYNRPGLDGKPRELHIEHALAVARYDTPGRPTHPADVEANQWQTLVASPYFMVERGRCAGTWVQHTGRASFQALLVCEGQGTISWGAGEILVRKGYAVLVPASQGAYELSGNVQVIRAHLPA